MKPNIMIISLVPLRADHLSCYGYHRETTPNIDRLAAEGTIYERAYSTASWTPPAHASLVTGRYPSSHGAFGDASLSDSVPTIAELLGELGYQSVGFVNASHLGKFKQLDRGFREFHELWRARRALPPGKFNRIKTLTAKARLKLRRWAFNSGLIDRDASSTTRKAIKWLDAYKQNPKKPYFMLLHYHEIHHPYQAPYPYKYQYISSRIRNGDWRKTLRLYNSKRPLFSIDGSLQITSQEAEVLKALYAAQVFYVDKHLGRLFAQMRRLDLMDQTVIIILSPHGESIGEHNFVGHTSILYESVVRIPLIIRFPGAVPSNLRVRSLVQITDVLPTVLELAEGNTNGLALQGYSLLPVESNRVYREWALAEWRGKSVPDDLRELAQDKGRQSVLDRFAHAMQMIRQDDYKYLRSSNGREELFNLTTDPDELNNLASQKPEQARIMAAQLEKTLGPFVPQSDESDSQDIEEDIADDLRSLGYKI